MSYGSRITHQTDQRVSSIPKRWEADVVIAGGGPAGFCAAVAAGRAGVEVLLIEGYGFLGGNATGGLVGPFTTTYFADEKVIAGLVDEVIDRLVARGGSLGTQKCPYPPGTTFGTGGWITTFEPDILKCIMDEMVTEAGAKLLLHSQVTGVERSNDGWLKSVILHNKSGCQAACGRVFIDATGDGDVAAWADAPYELGDGAGHGQPATLIFELSKVDLAAMKEYISSNPDDFAWYTFPALPSDPSRVCIAGSGFMRLIREAKSHGELHLGRNRITFFSGVRDGHLKVNATRVVGTDLTDIESLSQAELDGRAQAFSLFHFMRAHVPGCTRAELSRIGCYVGIRESRRIMGDYVLTAEDVLSGRRFADAIGCGAYPIDKHKVRVVAAEEAMDDVWIELQDAYDIPYRCLLPRKVEGLLVAGRPFSASQDAMASTRVMVHCMVMGQAAGTAAAIAAKRSIKPRDVPVEDLQSELIDHGAIIRSPDYCKVE